MTFFYDLNKRLADLAGTQLNEGKKPDFLDVDKDGNKKESFKKAVKDAETKKVEEGSTGDYSAKKAAAGKDIGKPGKGFAKIAKTAGEKYGSKEAGERVAGAVLKKLRHPKEAVQEGHCPACDCSPCECVEESALQGYLGKKKYGEEGMKALQKAGREHAGKSKMDQIRNRYDKMDETDMEEGNAFTGKLKATPKGEKFKLGNKEFKDTSNIEEGHRDDEDDVYAYQDDTKKRSHKTASGGTVTRHGGVTRHHAAPGHYGGYDPETDPDKDDDDTSSKKSKKSDDGAPKKRGRPAGSKRSIGAKGPSGKSKLMTREAELDERATFSGSELQHAWRLATSLKSFISDPHGKEVWNDLIKLLKYKMSQDTQELEEKAVSKQQQKFMGMAHAMQKGEHVKGASPELKKVAKTMKKSDVTDFAKTKRSDLPKKVKDGEPVKEEGADAPKSKGGMQYGKGVYEGLNGRLENMINEGMNVTVSLTKGPDGNPTKNINVSADGDDADKLAELLNLAGMQHSGSNECSTCGKKPCGCEQVDENSPDWPTNTETSKDAFQYSGGLNKPKSTGQTTVPVVASQLRRQASMEESVELERSLFKNWKNYKG